MLHLNLRDLQRGPVQTAGALDAADPVFVGLGLQFAGPVDVAGTLQQTGDGDYLWHGHIHGTLGGDCRRCLAAVSVAVDDDVDVLFSADPELVEDPGVYPIDPDSDQLDVSPAIREEIALRVSAFPLCRPDCRGLCASCGADLNAGACACARSGSTN